DLAGRERVLGGYADVAAVLPKGAKVLVHDHNTHLGIGAAAVNDAVNTQGGISYARLGTPRAVYDAFRSYGVTHLLWPTGFSSNGDSVAGDLVFFDFALRYGREARAVGGFTLARMPDEPPPESDRPDEVAVFGCGKGSFASGLYRLAQTHVPVFGPHRADFPAPVRAFAETRAVRLDDGLAGVPFVVIETSCHDAPGPDVQAQFTLAARRRWGLDLWLRNGR